MMLKIATFNVCGWKSAIKRELLKWMENIELDILAIQEIKTRDIHIPLDYLVKKYNFHFNPSKFHGTAIITRLKPLNVSKKLGHKRFDDEGRFLKAEYDEFTFINVYMPHGKRDKADLPYKLEVYKILIEYLGRILSRNVKPIILVGDFNIAHKEVDLARPKENENNIMFTKEERIQIDEIIQLGFIDSYRRIHPRNGYTWWLRNLKAREMNFGWRIDYIFITKQLESYIRNAYVQKMDISDHSPLIIEINL
ncbi:MAG: exodeoxyribonuclease III [Candidatus Methanomethylicia archaeon]